MGLPRRDEAGGQGRKTGRLTSRKGSTDSPEGGHGPPPNPLSGNDLGIVGRVPPRGETHSDKRSQSAREKFSQTKPIASSTQIIQNEAKLHPRPGVEVRRPGREGDPSRVGKTKPKSPPPRADPIRSDPIRSDDRASVIRRTVRPAPDRFSTPRCVEHTISRIRGLRQGRSNPDLHVADGPGS
jgi:hypothetical protein